MSSIVYSYPWPCMLFTATNNKQQTTNNHQPTTTNQQPPTTNHNNNILIHYYPYPWIVNHNLIILGNHRAIDEQYFGVSMMMMIIIITTSSASTSTSTSSSSSSSSTTKNIEIAVIIHNGLIIPETWGVTPEFLALHRKLGNKTGHVKINTMIRLLYRLCNVYIL